MASLYHRPQLIVVAVLGITFPTLITAAENEEATLPQVIARLAKWRASFTNLRVVYDLKSLSPIEEPLVDWSPTKLDLEAAPRWGSSEWIYTGKGLDFLESRSFRRTSGKMDSRDLVVFNGPKEVRFRASYRISADGIEEFKELHLDAAGGDKPFPSEDRPIMRALYFVGNAEWLHEVLARPGWKLEKIEPMLGEPCVRLSTEDKNGEQTNRAVLWLDVNHDCLPRRYQSLPNAIHKIGIDFVIDEYLQLPAGIWFPKSARQQLQTTPVQNQLIVVSEVAINEPLDLARFDPPAARFGTVVSGSRVNEFLVDGARTIPLEQSPIRSPGNSMALPSMGLLLSSDVVWAVAMIAVAIATVKTWQWWRRAD